MCVFFPYEKKHGPFLEDVDVHFPGVWPEWPIHEWLIFMGSMQVNIQSSHGSYGVFLLQYNATIV